MIVHFGLHLDGMQPQRPATALGRLVAGPARLVATLETELGLPPVRSRPGEALLAYRACLAERDDFARFYHASFALDSLGVARSLLGWRTQWHAAGWRGTFAGRVSPRLADLAAVESLARERVPLDLGQRAMRIAHALEQGLRTQIERVVLHDAPETLPAAWRALLAHFDCAPAPGLALASAGAPGSDLHRVQQTLLALASADHARPSERVRLAGDPSFIVVRGVSRDLTAQALAEHLLTSGSAAETALIAERDGIIVDNALERVGLARAGFQHYSRFRAVTQVLKLCLGLVWEPVSPELVLQFLIHPVGPLPDHVRSRLASAVAAQPGIGGQAWQEALGELALGMTERFGASDVDVRALGAEIAYWLECERYAAKRGAPIATLRERTERCAQWLSRRLHALEDVSEASLFAAAVAQCEALVAALEALTGEGAHLLPRAALEQLVDEVSGHAGDPGNRAEAGHVRAGTDPATVTERWPHVIWWDLRAPAGDPRYPWSEREHAELLEQGVALAPVAARIAARTREWLRPIVNAERRLVLVVHEREQGTHPIFGALASRLEHWREIRIEEALLAGDTLANAGLEIETRALAPRPLAPARRWWRLPAGSTLAPRPFESYSSLQKLIDYPHQWVLRYAARLQPGRAADLARGNLLNGNLAHRLFEAFFSSHRDWARLDARALDAWLEEALPTLLSQEAAVLEAPGAGVAREQTLAALESAFRRLLAQLRDAGLTEVEAERWLEAPLGPIRVRGGIDLLAKDAHGRSVVLDVKWGGEQWRGAELERGRALQLATYAYLCRTSGATPTWPAHAYFIVATGNIVAPDATVFAEALVHAPAEGETLERTWQRMARSIEWRWRQLAAGEIEVNAAGTAADEACAPPAAALVPQAEPDRFDEFTWLTGWEEGV